MIDTFISYVVLTVQLYTIFLMVQYVVVNFGYRFLTGIIDILLKLTDTTKLVRYMYSEGVYHHYFYNGQEFIVMDKSIVDRPDLLEILKDRNEILLVHISIDSRIIDITEDFKKFACYFNKYTCNWNYVLDYCLSRYSQASIFGTDDAIQIHYNNDELTSRKTLLNTVKGNEFDIYDTIMTH
jgi:hypothetical protein